MARRPRRFGIRRVSDNDDPAPEGAGAAGPEDEEQLDVEPSLRLLHGLGPEDDDELDEPTLDGDDEPELDDEDELGDDEGVVDAGERRGSVRSGDEPQPPDAVEPEPRPRAQAARYELALTELSTADDASCVCRFRTAGAALGFFAALSRARGPADAEPGPRCRRHPADGAIWVLSEAALASAAHLAWALGGQAFAIRDGALQRVRVASGGRPAAADATPASEVELHALDEVSLVELLASARWARAPRVDHAAVCAIVEGPVVRWVLRRCLEAHATVSLVAVQREALIAANAPRPGVLLQVSCQSALPAGLLRGIDSLPGVVLCRFADANHTLLLPVDQAPPLAPADLAALVPPGEQWLLGDPGTGSWRIVTTGQPTDLSELPELDFDVPADPGPIERTLPFEERPPIRVQLVASAEGAGRVDAALVDEAQLGLLSRYLRWRPLAETASILPGDGQYLVTEPAGLVTSLPFGVPLRFVGPEGLLVESSCALHPPLPAGARAHAFGLDRESVVVACRHGTWRFARANLVPAWNLWLGELPKIRASMSDDARALVERLHAVEAPLPGPVPPPGPGSRDGRQQQLQRLELMREAQSLELAGDFEEAAGLLERAGEYARAARLFERAAEP